MRILQILPALQSGGVETGTIDIARSLKKLGHEVYVMSSGGELVKELVKAGIPHETLPVHRKSLTSLLVVKTVRNFILKERIEIVHARSRVPAWIAFLAARKTGAVFVTTCHGYYSTHGMSRVMGWGREVIVISNVIGRHMIDDFGTPPERIRLVYRGVDLARYPFETKQRDRTPGGKFIVANIGRLTPIKGHPHFIRAIHIAASKIPHLEAWIVGEPEKDRGKYRTELEDLVQRLGLRNEVKFLGRREDIPEILNAADVLALTTNVPEAFGRVVIEAGARGTPVVATQVGGVTEIVESGKDGLLVPVDDDQALAQCFIDLWQDPAKAARFAGALRKKVEEKFSLGGMVEETLRVYEQALARKKILILKLGSLGDLILAVPSFRMIRKKYPTAKIVLVVDPRWYAIANTIPYLSEVVTYDRRGKGKYRRLWKLAERLREEGFDFSVDFQNNSKTHLLAALAQVPRRYGYRRGLTGFLLSHGVSFENRGIPPVEHQYRLLQLLGISELDDRLELWPGEADAKGIEAILTGRWVNPNQTLIGFSLSASRGWPTKNWPAGHFMDLARLVEQKLGARVLLLGDREAEPAGGAFDPAKFPSVINLTGKTSLGEWISCINRVDVLVTGDSAPMHVAAACGTPFVALFGPTDPRRHLPPARHFAVLRKNLDCAPCYSGECREKRFICLPGIEVEEVFREIVQLLEVKKAKSGGEETPAADESDGNTVKEQ